LGGNGEVGPWVDESVGDIVGEKLGNNVGVRIGVAVDEGARVVEEIGFGVVWGVGTRDGEEVGF